MFAKTSNMYVQNDRLFILALLEDLLQSLRSI
jgi:hypothetical protein